MLKKIIKAMIPPILLRLKHIGAPFYGIKGEFSSWTDAEEALQRKGLQDYAADNILQTVWKAIQTVREGEAEFERDGVLFYKKDYNYPLLAALFYSLASIGKSANILDFGGSLGSTYYQNRTLLSGLGMRVCWNIVEQEKFVELGCNELPEIQFYSSIEEFCKSGKTADILLLSSVLQYFDEPYRYLERCIKAGFQYILVDRTFFNFDEDQDRIAVQYVSPEIYTAQYPVCLLSYNKVIHRMKSAGYKEVFHWNSFDCMPVDNGDILQRRILTSKGFLVVRA